MYIPVLDHEFFNEQHDRQCVSIQETIAKHREISNKVKVVIGHSAGGSAALQLQQKYPNDIIPITYNAPVFAISNGLV